METQPALVSTRIVEDFLPLFRGIPELGDPFFLSMLHWCGVGKRPTPLAYWQVYILFLEKSSSAVIGLYRRPNTLPEDVWIGWFGVVAEHRGKGLGKFCLAAIEAKAANEGFDRLLVYCDPLSSRVHQFYLKRGFSRIGPASHCFSGETETGNDLVFAKMLVA
jgi:GNAT superfamily N-acetyltransferase